MCSRPNLLDVETTGLALELVVQLWGPDAKDSFVVLYNWVDSGGDDVEREGFLAFLSFSSAFQRLRDNPRTPC